MRPAVEGWFTTGDAPVLVGSRCTACGQIAFPKERAFCKNPRCSGDAFEDAELSPRGRVWSYTDAQYQPPAPYVPRTDPYEPFAIAAVELEAGRGPRAVQARRGRGAAARGGHVPRRPRPGQPQRGLFGHGQRSWSHNDAYVVRGPTPTSQEHP